MVDFVKLEIDYVQPKLLLENPKLEFHSIVNNRTGLLGPYYMAKVKNLKVRLKDPLFANEKPRISIEGSLHKFWNNGEHNFNDYGVSQIKSTLQLLADYLGFQLENSVIRNLEIGVNFQSPIDSEDLVNSCFMYGTHRLKWKDTFQDGEYVQAKCDRKYIKIYDKTKQFRKRIDDLMENIVRFEIKYRKMQYLNQNGIFSILDLINYPIFEFARDELLKEWDKVLLYDHPLLKDHKNHTKYANPLFWLDLTKKLSIT